MIFHVIYNSPSDYPGKWVLRKHHSNILGVIAELVAENDCVVRNSLKEIRACVPSGMMNLGREKDDDPVIHEVWI